MQSRKDRTPTGTHWFSRYWALIAIVVVASVLVAVRQPLLAADAQPAINQTVPPATPRPNNNNNDRNNNDNNDNNNNDSGNTAAPETPGTAVETTITGTLTGTNVLTAVVDVLALNVRQGPGTTFPVIGKLGQGNTVSMLATNAAGDWWLVCCLAGTQTPGWVSAALLVPGFSTEQTTTLPISSSTVEAAPLTTTRAATTTVAAAPLIPGSQAGTVAGVNLNVRSAPGTDNPVVGKLRANDPVSVLGRNETGDWLYICCIGSPPANGWVSAQFITPAFSVEDLDVVPGGASSTTPASENTAAASTTGTAAATTTGATTTGATTTGAETSTSGAGAATAANSGLTLAVSQQPPFAVQGREMALVYTVRNDSGAALDNVVLRSDLPSPLTLVGASAGGGAVTQNQAPLVEITWPSLAAGESATATVRVRVADDVPNGTTFANLATVTAGDQAASSGITIGMPPTLLPELW